ncbi:MAG: DUF3232 domain-containing protein [Candidatus Paceibacterota bacterium]
MKDSFLEGLWSDLAKNEHGAEHKEYPAKETSQTEKDPTDNKEWAVNAYLDMKNAAAGDSQANQLLEDVIAATISYIKKIDKLSEAKLAKDTPTNLEEKDESRRRAHDSLISCLNAFSRYCRNHKIDNQWRRVVGLERKEITEWAKSVIDIINKDIARRTKTKGK